MLSLVVMYKTEEFKIKWMHSSNIHLNAGLGVRRYEILTAMELINSLLQCKKEMYKKIVICTSNKLLQKHLWNLSFFVKSIIQFELN